MLFNRNAILILLVLIAASPLGCVKRRHLEIWNNTGRDLLIFSGEERLSVKRGTYGKIVWPNEKDRIVIDMGGRRITFEFIHPPSSYLRETRTSSIFKLQLNPDGFL